MAGISIGVSGQNLPETGRAGVPTFTYHLSGAKCSSAHPFAVIAGSRKAELGKVEPMLSSATPVPITGEWIFEPKLDGIRVIVTVDHDRVELRSRNGIEITKNYPGIVAALYRSASRPPMRYDGASVDTPFGLVPVDLIRQLTRGPDVLIVLIIVRSLLA